MSDSPYDEVGSRTRQAWLRTSLGLAAVTLLVLRSLVVGHAGVVLLLLVLVPVTAFVAIALRRMAALAHHESVPASRAVELAAAGSAVALAIAAMGAVVIHAA